MRPFLPLSLLVLVAAVAGCAGLRAQDEDEAAAARPQYLDPYEKTVYDNTNHITWLANANLPASNRFGLPLCPATGTDPCVNASGSMSYTSAVAWIAAMNKAKYLGSETWQLPTTPPEDTHCAHVGTQGNRFGFGCIEGAFPSLFFTSLGLKAPNTAVPVTSSSAGPFKNFQPYLYWSESYGLGGNSTFSFATGYEGANTQPNFLYVLPMIEGQIPGAPAATGTGLVVNPDGETVYDPETNVTWLTDANLAASNRMGLPRCVDPTDPEICVNSDGAMTWDSALVFVGEMNIANSGAGYLNQTNWQLPDIDGHGKCARYGCLGDMNPMGNLYYSQLKLAAGTPVVATPKTAVGPFNHVQPYLYWTCQGPKIGAQCSKNVPATNFEWSFSFGNGFQGTDLLVNDLYVTAYYPGCSIPDPMRCDPVE